MQAAEASKLWWAEGRGQSVCSGRTAGDAGYSSQEWGAARFGLVSLVIPV